MGKRKLLLIFKDKIVFVVSIPILIIFITAITSQYVALSYSYQINIDFQERLYQSQIQLSSQFTSIISQQLSNELQKIPIQIRMQNQFLSKLINSQVKIQTAHRKSMSHVELLYTNSEDPQITALFNKSPLLINSWYHQNITSLANLDEKGQTIATQFTALSVLQRTYDWYYRYSNLTQQRELVPNSFYVAFQYQGLYFLSAINTTFQTVQLTPNCSQGVYNYDVRCRYWFTEGKLQNYIQMLNPNVVYQLSAPTNSTLIEQQLVVDTNNVQQEFVSVLGYNYKLELVQNYFQNFANSTKQLYFISLNNQTIYYNSAQQNSSQVQIQSLSEVEFDYLKSKDDAKAFENAVSSNFSSYIYRQINQITKEQNSNLSSIQLSFPYLRNGTKTQVIINPIFIYDKIPQFAGVKAPMWPYKYNVEVPFLQISIVSNEDILSLSSGVSNLFYYYFLSVGIILGFLGFTTLIIILYYILGIQSAFDGCIVQLTEILNNMSIFNTTEDMFELNTDQFFMSQETSELFNSLKIIYLILLNLSNKFFEENESEILLKLYKNIEFFQQFQNIRALGITFNNIGSILLKQGYYEYALKLFQNSITYAKYEIYEFCKEYPNSQTTLVLKHFTFNQDVQPFSEKQKGASTQDKIKSSQQVKSTNQEFLSTPNMYEDNSYLGTKRGITKQSKIVTSMLQSISKLNSGVRCLQNQSTILHYEQELSEQRLQLLQNLFYRKRNYLFTLIAYQESIDRSKLECRLFNFWKEINTLLKELLKISNFLPLKHNQQIEIYLLISKCQLNLQKFEKSNQLIYLCEEYLSILYQQYQQNMKDTSLFNSMMPSEQSRKQSMNKEQEQEQLHKDNQNQNWDTQKISKSNQNDSMSVQFHQGRNERQPFSQRIRKQRAPTLLINNQSLDIQKDHQSQSMNLQTYAPILTQLKSGQDLPGQSQINIFQQSNINNTPDVSGLNLLSAEKNYSQILPEQNNNMLSVKGEKSFRSKLNLLKQQIQKAETRIVNNFNRNSNQNSMNQSNIKINIGKKSQFQSSSMNQGLPTQSQKQSQKLFDVLNKLQQSFEHSKYNNEDQKSIGKIFEKFKGNDEEVKDISFTKKIELIFEKQRKRESNLEKEYQLFNYYSTTNLETIMNFLKAESFIMQQDDYQAAIVLTSIFENCRYIVSHYPYMITKQIKEIFTRQKVFSKELDKLCSKFNPDISQQIGFIFACQLNVEQVFDSALLFSNIVNTVLNKPNDQLGIVLVQVSDSYVQQYMTYTQTKFIKTYMDKIISDIIKSTTMEKDKTHLARLCKEFNEEGVYIKHHNLATEVSKSFSFNQELSMEQSMDLDDEDHEEHHEQTHKTNDSLDQKQIQADNSSLFNFSKVCMYKQEDNQIIRSLSDISFSDIQMKDRTISNSSIIRANQTNIIKMSNIENTENTLDIHLRQELSPINQARTDNNLKDIDHEHLDSQEHKKDESCYFDQSRFNQIHATNEMVDLIQFSSSCTSKLDGEELTMDNFTIKESKLKIQQEIQSINQNQVIILDQSQSQNLNKFKTQYDKTKSISKSQSLKQNKNQITLKNLGEEAQESIRTTFNSQTSNLENEEKYLLQFDRNFLFHMCIRKALMDIQSNYNYQQMRKCNKSFSHKSLASTKNLNSFDTFDDPQNLQNNQQKFLIYCTDEVHILKNYLFRQLCVQLYDQSICVIIFSSQKGRNFLEQLPDQTFYYNNKEIFKVFYQNEQIISYLTNCRNSFDKYIYPTIIQHF